MNYPMMRIAPALCLAAVALAACDTVTDDVDRLESYNETANAYNDLRADVQSMPLSGAEMPTTGSATYDGYATILADTRTDTALVGDARLQADFTNSSLTGNLTNFVGTVDGSDYTDFNGSIAIRNGEIGGSVPSAIAGDVSGTLSSNTDVVRIDGGVQGNFRTDGNINAAGLTARDTAGTDFIVNGAEYDGDLGIVAIR